MHCISSVLRRQCRLSSDMPNLSHTPSLAPGDVSQPPCSSLTHSPLKHCSGHTSFGWNPSLAASSPPHLHLGNQQHTQGRAISSSTCVRTAHTPQACKPRFPHSQKCSVRRGLGSHPVCLCSFTNRETEAPYCEGTFPALTPTLYKLCSRAQHLVTQLMRRDPQTRTERFRVAYPFRVGRNARRKQLQAPNQRNGGRQKASRPHDTPLFSRAV